jgi:hypothetical protein
MKGALRTKILVGVALAIAGYVVFSPMEPQTIETARSGESKPRARSHPVGRLRKANARDLFLVAHRVADGASAKALFPAHSWYVPPPPPPPVPAPTLSAAELAELQAPKAPPLPFTFMGSYSPDGSTPVFFLTQGDRVYNVRVGETLDNTYTVDSFTNGRLLMTYKPLNIQQQLFAGGSR